MKLFCNKKSLFILIIACVGFNFYVKAQSQVEITNQIFLNCYQFKFKSADSLIANYPIELKKTTDFELIHSTVLWWKIISGNQSIELKQNYYKSLEKAEVKLLLEKHDNDNYIYKGISLYGYYARMDGLNKNYLKAFFRINKCIKFLQASFGRENEYNFFYLSSGLYNYYIVNAVKSYPIISPYLSFYPKGNIKKAFQYLEIASNSSNIALSTEANYFLMKIYNEEKKYVEASKYGKLLCNKFPSNLLFLYYSFKAHLQINDMEGAQNYLKKIYYYSNNSKQLSDTQKVYFIHLAEEDLKAYFLKEKK